MNASRSLSGALLASYRGIRAGPAGQADGCGRPRAGIGPGYLGLAADMASEAASVFLERGFEIARDLILAS